MTEEVETSWYVLYMSDMKKINTLNATFTSTGQRFCLWTPMQQNPVVRGVRNGEEFTPLYPGYLFVNYNGNIKEIENELRTVNYGFFLRRPGDDLPAKISSAEITAIKELEFRHTVTEATKPAIMFNIGDKVEIINGPFLGILGTVLEPKKDKVLVEISIFSRTVIVEVNSFSCILNNEQKNKDN